MYACIGINTDVGDHKKRKQLTVFDQGFCNCSRFQLRTLMSYVYVLKYCRNTFFKTKPSSYFPVKVNEQLVRWLLPDEEGVIFFLFEPKGGQRFVLENNYAPFTQGKIGLTSPLCPLME